MKIETFLNPEFIWIDENMQSSTEVFETVARKGEEQGYVNEKFLGKIKEREKTFPTGLQLDGYGVAIPHTDADCIEKQFVAVVVPTEGVPFKRMDDVHAEVKAQLIFVLGLNEPHSQLEMLQGLMGMLQDPAVITSLRKKENADEVIKYLTELSKQTQQ